MKVLQNGIFYNFNSCKKKEKKSVSNTSAGAAHRMHSILTSKPKCVVPPFWTLGSRPQMGSPSVFPGVTKVFQYPTTSNKQWGKRPRYIDRIKLLGQRLWVDVRDCGHLRKRVGGKTSVVFYVRLGRLGFLLQKVGVGAKSVPVKGLPPLPSLLS